MVVQILLSNGKPVCRGMVGLVLDPRSTINIDVQWGSKSHGRIRPPSCNGMG
jgi:hypothetical protein